MKGGRTGTFVSLEGIEGTGKSTQAKLLSEYLSKKGFNTILTEEPGGTVISRQIRRVLLSTRHDKMDYMAELLLYNAARIQHLKEKIIPVINSGKIVITDRFSDSTVAYQGYGRGISLKLIDTLDKIATGGMRPDITILFDLDVEIGLKRNRKINKRDRLELEDIEFHRRVREGYLQLAAMEPERIKLINASKNIDTVHHEIIGIINKFLQGITLNIVPVR
ncbi:MAG: dTMP kinase [Nitrospirae bacterium]|nr:dTMP kinase [Nitrospirota bacterium]